MNMYQNLNEATPTIQKQFTKNSHRSISATFRQFRKSTRFSLFGDYPILATITHTIASIGIIPSRQQVLYALNQSEELHDTSRSLKMTLLEQLENTPSVALNRTKNYSEQKKTTKMNNQSLKGKSK